MLLNGLSGFFYVFCSRLTALGHRRPRGCLATCSSNQSKAPRRLSDSVWRIGLSNSHHNVILRCSFSMYHMLSIHFTYLICSFPVGLPCHVTCFPPCQVDLYFVHLLNTPTHKDGHLKFEPRRTPPQTRAQRSHPRCASLLFPLPFKPHLTITGYLPINLAASSANNHGFKVLICRHPKSSPDDSSSSSSGEEVIKICAIACLELSKKNCTVLARSGKGYDSVTEPLREFVKDMEREQGKIAGRE